MTEDLLERRLSASMERRAGAAAPAPRPFAEVEQRAARQRRARARGAGAVAVAATVLVVLGVVAVSGRPAGDDQVAAGPATDPSTPPVTAPAVVGDRWPVLASVEPTRTDPAETTVSGLQPSTGGMQEVEIAPYVYVGRRSERAVVYELTGDRWRSTVAWTDLPSGGAATTTSVTGTGFDPQRLDEIENTSDLYESDDPTSRPPDRDPLAGSARPEDLLAAPDSRPVVLPVEHHGLFDWVVLPELCSATADSCRKTAVGGDATRLVVVDLYVATAIDLRSVLAEIELRSADEVALTPPADPAGPLGVGNGPYERPAAWGAAPFFQIVLPIVRDDSVWPADVPTDYCTAFRQWKGIQIDHLGSFGLPGWIRWAEALGQMAPPELVELWGVVVSEQSAGHDTSATAPGNEALTVIVDDGDARCPV
jgi:hypothetical protein